MMMAERVAAVIADKPGTPDYDDVVTERDALLAVLRQCVEALDRCDKHFQHGAGYVCDALCAASRYTEGGKDEAREEGDECCCKRHHQNHGRCLQCPVHGVDPTAVRDTEGGKG